MKKNIYGLKTLLKKNRGSSTIFLSIVLGGIITMIFLFIFASQRVGTVGYVNSILTLSFKSIMSEYSIELKDRYGILGFYGRGTDIEKKMFYYANYSFENHNIKINNLMVNLEPYSLADSNVLQEEMIDYSKFAMGRKIFDEITGEETAEKAEDSRKERTLANEGIKNTLPSRGQDSDSSIWKKIINFAENGEDFMEKTTDEFLLNQYVLNMFGNYHRQIEGESFFKGEVEYILNGEFSDKKNYEEYIGDLKLLRNGLNVAHIVTDPEKMTKIQATAQSITPGPFAAITQIGIIELWAYVEANNDIKLLENGKKVPLIKTKESWATDLTSILSNTEKDYIEPEINRGFSYEGYLMMFLIAMENEIKVARAADLIQINMQGLYNENFLLMEYNTGFNVEANINGKKYRYKEEY